MRGILFALLVWPIVWPADAKVIVIFDIDGTIFNDKGPDAAWRTPWLLKRIEQMHSLFQQPPNQPISVELTDPDQIRYYRQKMGLPFGAPGPLRVKIQMPEQIAVSYDEFYRLQEGWAKSETIAGDLKPALLAYDPLRPKKERLIIPGYYRTFDLTFKYYRESRRPPGQSYPVNDYIEARERARLLGAPYTYKGRAFPLYQAMMSNPETVLNAQRSTSRGHSQAEYWALDDRMVLEGDIASARGPNGERPIVHSLSQPDARTYGETLVQKKVAVVRGSVEAQFRSAGSRHRELHPDARRAASGEQIELNTVIVPEDEPYYVAAIAEEMVNLSASYFSDRVKLVLFNCGSDHEVAEARFPWRWTVFFARQARAATESEIEAWLHPNGCEAGLLGPTESEPKR